MPLDTHSDHRVPVAGVEVASRDELHLLGISAARQRPAHETKKLRRDEVPIPRESKIGFAIGAGILFLCVSVLAVRAIVNRPATPLPGGGTALPAIKTAEPSKN